VLLCVDRLGIPEERMNVGGGGGASVEKVNA